MNQIILEAKNISKSFGKTQALKNVDFYLNKAQIHGLLGENGAGKSSLMNILSGIYQPEGGSIYIEGEKVKKLNPDLAARFGIGMVHQEFRLINNFSIKDNLTLSKSNIYKANFEEAFEKYSEIFSLSAKSSILINELSVGEKQKIEIIKLIFNDNNIMLLDEPTAGLSPKYRGEIFGTIQKIKKTGVPILIVEQNAKQALAGSDRGYVLVDGANRHTGKGSDSLADREIARMFLGGGH